MPGPIIVDKSPPDRSGFSGPPTRDGSTEAFSLLNVLHSDPTSITLNGTGFFITHYVDTSLCKGMQHVFFMIITYHRQSDHIRNKSYLQHGSPRSAVHLDGEYILRDP